ncbi:MAG: dihydropteroate synthase [Lentisphaerae bacterium]|nr:dihydropteroate synthase [Lentisphaerota bacterium]
MLAENFIIIGENIHCSRTWKRSGRRVGTEPGGRAAILYEVQGQGKFLPIPEHFLQSADWANGKIKHCAVAIWQGLYGTGADGACGLEYLHALVQQQEEAGAAFLDINVDDFSMDLAERIQAMTWTAAQVQRASALPLSIDSSHVDIMRAGLQACQRSHARPLLNSISLERLALLDLLAEYQPAVVASAAGVAQLPASTAERLANLEQLIPQLLARGLAREWIHVDPLVYTLATDQHNGRIFLESVAAVRRVYGGDLPIIGGLSNISFGLPRRQLINQVFAWLMLQAGGSGGIVDPLQVNARLLSALDSQTPAFQLTRDFLEGRDDFGLNFIAAYRAGRLG